MNCRSAESLFSAFLDDELNQKERRGLEAHLLSCKRCSMSVRELRASLQLLDAVDLIDADLRNLESAVARQAVRHKDTVMIGRTHGIHAEPTTFGFKLAGWVAEIRRAARRLAEARKDVAVGKPSHEIGNAAACSVPVEAVMKACRELLAMRPPVAVDLVSGSA